MGMTISEAISKLRYELNKNNKMANAYAVAIDTMRKYQKIVDIVSLSGEEFKQCGLKELKDILEVIEDGRT